MEIRETRKALEGVWIQLRFDNGAVKRFRSAHITAPLDELKEDRWRAFAKAAKEAYRDGLYADLKDDWKYRWTREDEDQFVKSEYAKAVELRPDLFQ